MPFFIVSIAEFEYVFLCWDGSLVSNSVETLNVTKTPHKRWCLFYHEEYLHDLSNQIFSNYTKSIQIQIGKVSNSDLL